MISGWNLIDDSSLWLHFEEVRRNFGKNLSVRSAVQLLRKQRNASFY
jgi:hypothetical protein